MTQGLAFLFSGIALCPSSRREAWLDMGIAQSSSDGVGLFAVVDIIWYLFGVKCVVAGVVIRDALQKLRLCKASLAFFCAPHKKPDDGTVWNPDHRHLDGKTPAIRGKAKTGWCAAESC
jgi:hypothetical protein